MQPTDVLMWTAGGVAGTGMIGFLIRWLVVTAFSTKSQAATIHMGDTMLTRLQSEITRLEVIIGKQNERIVTLELKVNELRGLEMLDMSDFAEIRAIVETSCMSAHPCPSNLKLKSIVDRIAVRRAGVVP